MTVELTEAEQMRHALMAEKHAQAKALLRDNGIDCWLTFSREGSDLLLPYVVGAEGLVGTAALMLFVNGPSVAIVADYDVGQVDGIFEQVLPYSLDWREPFHDTLRERNPARIAINYSSSNEGIDGLTYGMYLKLQDALKPLGFADRLVTSEPIAGRVRAIKTAGEIERIRRACEITVRIFDDLTGMLRPGLTEAQIAEIMQERMQTYEVGPSWEASYCPTVSSSRSRRGHTPPGAVVLEPGDGLAVDFGVINEGYASDLMRTWYFKKPGETGPPDEMVRAFDTVREGIELAASLIKPGVRGVDVDEPVRSLVHGRGYTFTHGLGHQVGRAAHDGGMMLGPNNARYGDRSSGVIEAGMCFTLEPVVTWVGLEDNVVVTETGCEFLNAPQRDVQVI
jgi:Xaa-Pro aminopeptidase